MNVSEEREGHFAFLSFGESHLALQQVQGSPEPSTRAKPGLYHIAFEVEKAVKLGETIQYLKSKGIEYG